MPNSNEDTAVPSGETESVALDAETHSVPCGCALHEAAPALYAELVKARDTYADFIPALRLFRHDLMADALQIAKDSADKTLALAKPLVSPIDFSCGVCGVECAIAPDPPARAVCPEHCEDHDYVHDRSRAGKYCQHCDKEQPLDWR